MALTVALFVAWSANSWNAAGQLILAVGAIVAAAWAVFLYRRAKRAEAARWLQGLFRDFYTDPALVSARENIEYDFVEKAAPLLEKRVTDRHLQLDHKERDTLRQIDLVLNFFEQLLYLEGQGHISRKDREVFFQYWFELMKEPDRAALRRYLARCGYERCARWLGTESSEHIAFYGSLMSAYGTQDELGVRGKLEYVGPCVVEGQLYSRGEFPCVVPGDGRTRGELFSVTDLSVFRQLDGIEHYDPGQRDESLYLRRCVRLLEPQDTDAWVYLWNGSLEGLKRVDSGSWPDSEQEISVG